MWQTRWRLEILNRTFDGQVMAFSLSNGDGKEFFFMFIGSSCQGDFIRGVEELHNLNSQFCGE